MNRSYNIDVETQHKFMYLFERVSEPIYFSPRGHGRSRVIYNTPLDRLPPNIAQAVAELRKSIPPGTAKVIEVPYPSTPYDLSQVKVVPRHVIFSLFSPKHQEASEALVKIYNEQKSINDFFSTACLCRDEVNPYLWVYSTAVVMKNRPELKGFRFPAYWEIMPDRFLNNNILREARRQAVLPEGLRSVIVVDQNFTGLDLNQENKVAYFREDLGLNSHHWHWHIVFPLNAPRGQRDRKGELFFYMHHNMINRKEAERLANGLNRLVELDIQTSVEEGYFPKLTLENSQMNWGTRQPNTPIQDVNRMADPGTGFRQTKLELKVWNDRILEAIDQSIVITSGGQTISLSNDRGIDILGDLVEPSDLSVNRQLYGSFHNGGHNILCCAHDPDFRFKENPGVMFDTATAVRDPVFFRWHKHIDEVFLRHKNTLPPYTPENLLFPGVKITDFNIRTVDRTPNTLVTFWEQHDIDLSRGLDFGRTNFNNLGPVWARYTHIQHEPFSYRIQVNSPAQLQGTVRIFMAPRVDEHQARLRFVEQRQMFFEMDKFVVTLRPGVNNIIERRSDESTVTIPFEQTFRDLERETQQPTVLQSVCGCGLPANLLVPKGKPDGQPFDVFVMISNWEQDKVRRKNPISENERQGCRDSSSFCGILDELYPDSKPMGYPFDKPARRGLNGQEFPFLEDWMIKDANMATTQIDIFHRNVTTIASGGAAQNLPLINQAALGTDYSRSGDVMGSNPSGTPMDWVDLGKRN